MQEASIKCIWYGLSWRQGWGAWSGDRDSQWLASISPVDRICLAEKYDIPPMLVRVLTPLVSPNKKTFKVVLVCCSHDPSPHPPSIFGGFSGSFASVCSRPSGVPVTSPLFSAAFEDVLHLFVFIISLAFATSGMHSGVYMTLPHSQKEPSNSQHISTHISSTVKFQ